MGTSLIDHTQLPPERWEAILRQALSDLRANPGDPEALEAVKDANTALNAYEQPAIEAGKNVGEWGFGKVGPALEGIAKGIGDVPMGVVHTILHPIETVKSLPKLPGAIASGFTSGDPEQIARTVTNVGALALPFARTSKAAGAPTVAGAMSELVARPFRAVGNVLERPGLKNAVLTKQAARASQLAEHQAERAPLMKENIELRNAVLRERLKALQGAESDPTSTPTVAEQPTAPEVVKPALKDAPSKYPGVYGSRAAIGPELKPVTPAMEALSKMHGNASLEEIINRNAQPKALDTGTLANVQFEEGLPPMSPTRLLGPMASEAEINALIQSLLKAQEKGYPPLGVQ